MHVGGNTPVRMRAERTCVGCRGRAPTTDLLRVVAAEVDGIWSVVPDPLRRLPGRGASLHPVPECLALAERRRAFPRALRREGPLELSPLRTAVLHPEQDPAVSDAAGSARHNRPSDEEPDCDERAMSTRR